MGSTGGGGRCNQRHSRRRGSHRLRAADEKGRVGQEGLKDGGMERKTTGEGRRCEAG
jgi:hypothetical protein